MYTRVRYIKHAMLRSYLSLEHAMVRRKRVIAWGTLGMIPREGMSGMCYRRHLRYSTSQANKTR